MAHHAEALRIFDRQCERDGVQTYRPDPFHVCTRDCAFFEIRGLSFPVYVCRRSKVVHDCGSECKRAIPGKNNEGYVCDLTGICMKAPILQNHVGYSREDPKKRTNDHYTPVGRGRRQTAAAKKAGKWRQCQVATREKFVDIMFGKERRAIFDEQKARVVRDVARMIKACKGQTVPLVEYSAEVMSKIKECGAALNRPAAKVDAQAITVVADAIFRFYKRLVNDTAASPHAIECSRRQAEVFAACMCQRLSTGHSIKGTQVGSPRRPRAAPRSWPPRSWSSALVVLRAAPVAPVVLRPALVAPALPPCSRGPRPRGPPRRAPRHNPLVVVVDGSVLSWRSPLTARRNFQVVPKVPWFTRHVPAEISFGRFKNVSCRHMSKLNRKIQRACVGPSGVVRYGLKLDVPETFPVCASSNVAVATSRRRPAGGRAS